MGQSSGVCRLCGEHRSLTKEHVIPKSAGNTGHFAPTPLHALADRRRPRPFQNGFYRLAFCDDCRKLVNVYEPSFRWWNRQATVYLSAKDAQQSYRCHVQPLNVLRRIVAMALSMNSVYDVNSLPWIPLREFVMGKRQALPDSIRVHIYFRIGGKARFVPPASVLVWDGYRMLGDSILTECSCAQIGYVVSETDDASGLYADVWEDVEGSYLDTLGLCEITDWQGYKPDESASFELSVPRLEPHTPVPLDYRPLARVKAEAVPTPLPVPQAKASLAGWERVDLGIELPKTWALFLATVESQQWLDLSHRFGTLAEAEHYAYQSDDHCKAVVYTHGQQSQHRLGLPFVVIGSDRLNQIDDRCQRLGWRIERIMIGNRLYRAKEVS